MLIQTVIGYATTHKDLENAIQSFVERFKELGERIVLLKFKCHFKTGSNTFIKNNRYIKILIAIDEVANILIDNSGLNLARHQYSDGISVMLVGYWNTPGETSMSLLKKFDASIQFTQYSCILK